MIDFTVSSVITTIIACNLFIVYIYIVLNSTKKIVAIGYDAIIISIILLIIRLAFPVEMLNISRNVYWSYNISKYLDAMWNEIGGTRIRVMHVPLFIWMFGFAIKSVYLIRETVRFDKYICKTAVDVTADKNVRKCLEKYKKKRLFRLIVLRTNKVESAQIAGLFVQKVLLPQDIELSDDNLELILRHEITHYNNCDLLLKFFVALMNCMFWWNPVTLLVRNETNEILEIRVDHEIASNKETTIKYMELLVASLNDKANKEKTPIMTLASNKSILKKRFEYMTSSGKVSFKRYFYLLITVCFFVLSYIFIFEPYYDNPDFGMEEGAISLNRYNAYMVHKSDGTYDIYYKDRFWGNITEMDESLEPLDVINEKDDWKKRIAYMFVTPDRFEKMDE